MVSVRLLNEDEIQNPYREHGGVLKGQQLSFKRRDDESREAEGVFCGMVFIFCKIGAQDYC